MSPSFFARFFDRFRVGNQSHPQAKTAFGIGALIEQRYRLDAELGRGGMGIVYRARDLTNQREVAIKVINASEAGVSSRQQFLREAQITARLDHPHIVAVYESGTVDTGAPAPSPYIVMEFIQGGSLDDLHGLTFAQIINLGEQICDALEYAHSQGLVHRDLKPGNVLVEKQGYRYNAKLMDFGLARLRGESDLPEKNIAGTVYYIAPEVAAGKPAEVAADLYALGAMLYKMVTGRVPFSDFDAQSILSQHLEEAVVPPSHTRSDVPPALEAIILRLLAKDPLDRYASAQQVKTALEQIVVSPEPVAARNNLPQLLSPFLGRENEMAQVKKLLEAHRAVTLTGFDGIGKTRLALATAAGLIDQFSDGVWLIELAPWSDPALVPQTVAAVLGVREESRRPLIVSLTEYLREKNLLLLFDQCDPLGGACAQLAQTLLRTCTDVRILATSQRALNFSDEMVYPVPSLTLPTPDESTLAGFSRSDATRLLLDRLGATSLAFKVSDENVPVLVRLCRQCAGVPLAIELIAARAKGFSPAEITTQLEPSPTIDAVIAWSYRRLNEQERELLNRLSIFVGGFTLNAVESISGNGNLDVMNLLAQLVAHSFVETGPSGNGETRYRLLEPIRKHALAQLQISGKEEILRRHHRDGYFLLALKAEAHLHTFEHGIWLRRLEIEHANILAALDWTIGQPPPDASTALRFGGALWQFWSERNYWREGRDRLEKILRLESADASARAKLLTGAGYLAVLQADDASAQAMLEQGLALARKINDRPAMAYALCGLGSLAQARRDFDRAAEFYREGWEQFRAVGNAWESANALYNLGILNMRGGDYASARSQFLSSLDTFRQIGDKRRTAQALGYLGVIAYDRQEHAEAREWFDQSLVVWRGLYDKAGMAHQLNDLGYVALRQGRYAPARDCFIASLGLFKELNRRRNIADGLYGLAGIAGAQNHAERAATLIGAADALLQAPGAPAESFGRVQADKHWITARIALDSELLQDRRAAGRAMGLERAILYASEE